METIQTNDWQTNYNYIESQLNNLVRTSEVFKFAIFDNYGNKTKYLNINKQQLDKIEKILKNI